ncbi:glycosyltransferase family 4 protein [Streptomyces sp. NPDC004082]
MSARLKIALIASARHPIREPFAGGLEAHTWSLARDLGERGHHVTLFAGAGSDPALGVHELPVHRAVFSDAARADLSMTDPSSLAEHHAYLRLMVDLCQDGGSPYDVIHNNSLHYLPVAMAPALRTPVVTTLHTPPTPWLESAVQTSPGYRGNFTAVSDHTARAWAPLIPSARVIHNGVDTRHWRPGPGGTDLVWFGRLVPEKGPHLAIEAAREAGLPLRLAGPTPDRAYFDRRIAPRLGDGVSYEGHLTRDELIALVGRAGAALATPCWDEPYGLVVAEALACGTPVCGFDRGALREILTPECGRLVPWPDTSALAEAIGETLTLDRAACRERAVRHCSLEAMTDRYELLYEELMAA